MTTRRPSDRNYNLPNSLTPFIGRRGEVESLCALLRTTDVRLLTLTGPGGVGKTRLAMRVATDLGDAFVDGVVFVPLASVRDPGLVISTVAQSIGVTEEGDKPLIERLKDANSEKQLLMVLDNFEQVLNAAPNVVELLIACPNLKVLVTSRAVLHVSGERDFPVPPLALPDEDHDQTIGEVARNEAVRLFVERAQAVNPSLDLTESNVQTVTNICRRLEGLPLAIELAAARSNVLPPHALLHRLEKRLPILTGGPRDQPARLRTMRDAIAWSYDLLNSPEQVVFRRLAVFLGGFTTEAATQIVGATEDGSCDLLEQLSKLVENSLIQPPENDIDNPRFTMLETVREFAVERLEESGELDATRELHAMSFVNFAEESSAHRDDLNHRRWMDRLDTERDNLRAAFAWAIERKRPEQAIRLVRSLRPLWLDHGPASEGRLWLDQALALPGNVPPKEKSEALILAHDLATAQGVYEQADECAYKLLALVEAEYESSTFPHAVSFLAHWCASWEITRQDRVRNLCERALSTAQISGEKSNSAQLLSDLGILCRSQEQYDRAMAYCYEALEIWEDLGNIHGRVTVLKELSDLAWLLGDEKESFELRDELEELVSKSGDPAAEEVLLWDDVLNARFDQDYTEAAALLETEATRSRGRTHPAYVAQIFGELGEVYALQGDLMRAADACQQELTVWRQMENIGGMARALKSIARINRLQGQEGLAMDTLENALLMAENASDDRIIGEIFNEMGLISRARGDYARASVLHERALEIFKSSGWIEGALISMRGLRESYHHQGHRNKSLNVLEAELSLRQRYRLTSRIAPTLLRIERGLRHRNGNPSFRELAGTTRSLWTSLEKDLYSANDIEDLKKTVRVREGHPLPSAVAETMAVLAEGLENARDIETVLVTLGEVARLDGNLVKASTILQKAVELIGGVGNERLASDLLIALGEVACDNGDEKQAFALFYQVLTIADAPGEAAGGLIGLAYLAAMRGDLEQSARFCGTIEMLADAELVDLGRETSSDRYEHAVALARLGLEPSAFAAACSRGRALTLEEVVAEVEAPTDNLAGLGVSGDREELFRGELTTREIDVARLIAKGHTNRQIAEELFLSSLTVKTHVGNILRKLDLPSRSAVAAFVQREGLV